MLEQTVDVLSNSRPNKVNAVSNCMSGWSLVKFRLLLCGGLPVGGKVRHQAAFTFV